MHPQQIGRLLVARGLLTEQQVQQVLDAQGATPKAFGRLASQLFGIDPAVIYRALADQVIRQATEASIVHETVDGYCRSLVTAWEAWEHLVLPMRIEAGCLVCAATVETLPEAIELMERATPLPCRFVLAPCHLLEQYVEEQYDFDGIEVSDDPGRWNVA